MKRKIFVILLLLPILVACGSDKAWRKAAADSYDVLGAAITSTKPTAEMLRAANTINDDQLAKVKDIYNKARQAYIAAGAALKLASNAQTEAQKQAALQDYSKLLGDFNALLLQITDLINSFSQKKVSLLEIETWVKGGEL